MKTRTTSTAAILRMPFLLLFLAATLFLANGCQKGAGERAGEKVDDVIEDVGDTTEDMVEEVEEAVEDLEKPK